MLVYRSEVFSRSSSLWPQHHSHLILPWHVYGVWWCLGSPFFSSSTTGQAHRFLTEISSTKAVLFGTTTPPAHLGFQWHFSRFTSRFPSLKMLPHKSGWVFEPASWGPGVRGKSFAKISRPQPPLRLVARAAVWLLCYEILGSNTLSWTNVFLNVLGLQLLSCLWMFMADHPENDLKASDFF